MNPYPVQTTGWMGVNTQVIPAGPQKNNQQNKSLAYGKNKVTNLNGSDVGPDGKKRRMAQSKSYKNIQMHNNLIEDSKIRGNSN